MHPLMQTVGHNVVQDLFEQATVPGAPGQAGWRSRRLPPGFTALAFAGLLFIAAAGVHECVREGPPQVSRQRTNLRSRKIAYASWNRMGIP